MDERPTNRGGPLYWLKRRSRLFWIAVVLLPVLYVLSVGPASRLARSSLLTTSQLTMLAWFYEPLNMTPRPIHDALSWYADLWDGIP